MGACCKGKEDRNKISINNSKSFNGTSNKPKPPNNIKYEINNQKTRPETWIDNERFAEYNELMKLMLNNLTKTKQTRKKTIGQGGQAKIRKYYSNKYKEYVVEKVINIESSTRATLGERGFWI